MQCSNSQLNRRAHQGLARVAELAGLVAPAPVGLADLVAEQRARWTWRSWPRRTWRAEQLERRPGWTRWTQQLARWWPGRSPMGRRSPVGIWWSAAAPDMGRPAASPGRPPASPVRLLGTDG
ncbi:MAG: hypothetical protein ACRDUS_19610 [Mycobacterium sp.]